MGRFYIDTDELRGIAQALVKYDVREISDLNLEITRRSAHTLPPPVDLIRIEGRVAEVQARIGWLALELDATSRALEYERLSAEHREYSDAFPMLAAARISGRFVGAAWNRFLPHGQRSKRALPPVFAGLVDLVKAFHLPSWWPWHKQQPSTSTASRPSGQGNSVTQPPPLPKTGSAGTPSAAETAAVNWATNYPDKSGYGGACLAFVFDAYRKGAEVDLWKKAGWMPANPNETYPIDLWPHLPAGSTGSGTPPPGALVFFSGWNGDRTLSHVTISVGGGRMISTADHLGEAIHTESLSQYDGSGRYLGWWLPA